jgi:hypothetical protein
MGDIEARNIESWQRVIAFYERIISEDGWLTYIPVLELVTHLATTEVATRFRAGHAIFYLMISTKSQHGLEIEDPYIEIRLINKWQQFQIEYYDGQQSTDTYTSALTDVLTTLKPVLDRLWNETRG